MIASTKSTSIETVTCGRCGGSGKYSYNMMHGDRCYGCGGTGKVYTKRGKVAAAYLNALRHVPVETLKVGDLVQEDVGMNGSTAFFHVEAIKTGPANEFGYIDNTSPMVKLVLQENKHGLKYSLKFAGTAVRKGFTVAEKQEQLRLALEYQDSLTTHGKPRKA